MLLDSRSLKWKEKFTGNTGQDADVKVLSNPCGNNCFEIETVFIPIYR